MNKPNISEILESAKILRKNISKTMRPIFSDVNPGAIKVAVGLAVAIPVLFLIFNAITGDDGRDQALVLTAGKTYILENANRGPLLLTAAPTLYASTDFLGKESEGGACLVPPKTRATLIEQILDNHIAYARMKPIEGRCEGRVGWTAIVNVRELAQPFE